MKALLYKSSDPYMALLSFRATPIPWCSFSPAELLMGRKIRTDIPTAKSLLTPNWPYLADFLKRDIENKAKQKQHDYQRHRTQTRDPLLPFTPVWIMTGGDRTPGQIRFLATIPGGEVRRNRQHVTPFFLVITRS